MRSRSEIEAGADNSSGDYTLNHRLILEVALDIRDILLEKKEDIKTKLLKKWGKKK